MNGDADFQVDLRSLNTLLVGALTTNTGGMGASSQAMGITDVLCEGPIEGLIDGVSSIYLNDNEVEPNVYAAWVPGGGVLPSLAEIQAAIQQNDSILNLAPRQITFSQASSDPDEGVLKPGYYIPQDFELGTGRKMYLKFHGAAVSGTTTVNSSTNAVEVTLERYGTSSTAFTQADWETKTNPSRIARLSRIETVDCYGEVSFVDADTLIFRPESGDASAFPDEDYYSIEIYYSYDIESFDRTARSITIDANNSIPSGDYFFFVDKAYLGLDVVDTTEDAPSTSFIEGFGVDFRHGKLEAQAPFNALIDADGGSSGIVGSASGINLPELKQLDSAAAISLGVTLIDSSSTSYPEGQSGDRNSTATILNSSDFGLDTASKIREADEIYYTIKYPSFQSTNLGEGANHEAAYARYLMEFDIKLDGAWTNNYRKIFTNYDENYIVHRGNVRAARSYEHRINLDVWRPFEDFRIRIIRLTRHIGLSVTSDGTNGGRTDREKWQLQAKATVDTLGAVIKDKFEFPGTAAAQITFSSRQFQQPPKRSYHLRGKKVRIPTTYTPRELSSDGLAKYEEFWGGTLKGLYYTNNPAWVFLDLLTNSRYGAGKWIKDKDIDLYALYRISKYCDELVEDGKTYNVTDLVPGTYYKIKSDPSDTDFTDVGANSGYSVGTIFRATDGNPGSGATGQVFGVEPRYTANIFLTKATDVYKVIKDMATLFAGIIYYLDGKITAVQDVPQDPVYSFTQANVLEGSFSYETTGTRTKTNQIVVTWNDPTINYTPVPIIVEDRESIARTGRIISQNAMAFGCTSEGQAIRLGKWKLWTAQHQTEVVNFSTGLQGAFVRPGDIITVSDKKRTGISYSGRASSATSTTLTFDRSVSFNSGSNYVLRTVVTKPTAIYSGAASVTINSTTYNTGDVLPEAYVYLENSNGTFSYQLVNLTSEKLASNAFLDSSGNTELNTEWKYHTYVEQNNIVNPGTSATSVTLANSATFGTTPVANTIWALEELNSDGDAQEGSHKLYKILAIQQTQKNVYAISAVEHYNEKFAEIEQRFQVGVTPASIFTETEPNIIPPVENLALRKEVASNGQHRLIVEWDPPSDFNSLSHYELKHDIPGNGVDIRQNPIITGNTTEIFDNVGTGTYTIRVRVVSSKGKFSLYENETISLGSIDSGSGTDSGEVSQRIHGLPRGIVSDVNTLLTNNGNTFGFENANAVVASNGSPGDSVTMTTQTIDVSGLASGQKGYVIFDHSSASIGLYAWDTTTLNGTGFWRPIGNGSGGQTEFTRVLGTYADDKVYVVGTIAISLLNLTTTEVDDIIAFKDTVPSTSSTADNVAVITREFTTTISTTMNNITLDRNLGTVGFTNAWIPVYRPDLQKDAVVAILEG